MIWLIFLNIRLVLIDENKSLQKLYIMNEANKLVSPISIFFGSETSKINDAKNCKDHFNGIKNNSNFHEYLTSFNMIFLNSFHGFYEVFFLIYEWFLLLLTFFNLLLNTLRITYALSFRALIVNIVSFFQLFLFFLHISLAPSSTFLLRNIWRWVDIWFSMLFFMFLWYFNACI